jgi:hypothetical protein
VTAFWPRQAVALAGFALLVLSASSAGAVYQCGPDKDDCKCGMDQPYPCCSNGGNCTWWAWEQACCHWAVGLPGWGNANQWAGNAKTNPKYDVLSSPVVGSIAVRVSGSYGHVAWVTAVNGSKITVTEQNCWGGWGHQTSTYSASYFDGGFVVQHADCECQPGQSQTQSCGNCGEKKRTCASSCKWGSWGACGGEGACTPGTDEEKACGDCGKKSRSCQSDCSWGEFGACAGPDPGDGGVACNTGMPGVCAKGTQQCVDGNSECVATTEPTAEICDGLDNDCNGSIDDSTACWQKGGLDGGTAKPPVADGGHAAEGSTDAADVSGEASCSLPAPAGRRDSGAALVALMAAAWLWRRRRAAESRAFPR